MSMFPSPGNAGFNEYPPGPHSGVPTDPDAHVVSDSLDRRIWRVIRSRWTVIGLVCVVVAVGAFLSLT
jgi:hypothetical protein